jgi:hypothetical protein
LSLGTNNLPIIAILLVALLAAIYAPSLGRGFVKDDFRWIAAADVHSPADVGRLFSTNVGFYRPLVTASFAVDRAVWRLDARGYALTNTLLLLANAAALFLICRRLSLRPEAALFAAAVWTFNFHGINMALLWTSGRTALLVCLFSQAAALAVLAERRWTAGLTGLFALAAMLCKEEAVMLPPLVVAIHLWTGRARRNVRAAFIASWPVWAAAAVYVIARARSGAFGAWNAPEYYRLTVDPATVLHNVGEYFDRGATCAAIVSLILWFCAPRTAAPDGEERSAMGLGICWFIAMFAITIFLPVRSSLYAVVPSIGSALVAGACAARLSRTHPVRFSRIAALLIAAVVLLLPVYRSRNHGLVEPAQLATEALVTIQAAARGEPDARDIVLVDDPRAAVTLDSAFGTLFPDAVHLFVGPAIRGTITNDATAVAARNGAALVFTLREGRLIQEPAPRPGPSESIHGKPAAPGPVVIPGRTAARARRVPAAAAAAVRSRQTTPRAFGRDGHRVCSGVHRSTQTAPHTAALIPA